MIRDSSVAAVISDPNLADTPIIACNQAFVDLTGTLISVFDLSLDDHRRTTSLRLETPSTESWHGIPHEVYHTAFFTTVPFERFD